MRSILPEAADVTAASPLIARETEKLAGRCVRVINNSFYQNEFKYIEPTNDNVLKFVWFSQNISYGRGLEVFITAIQKAKTNISLTLIGNLNEQFNKEWIIGRSNIYILAPLSQEELHLEIAKYDVGLAIELESADFNRSIALTNKIFAYLQSGIYLLATDTPAQQNLLQQNLENASICRQNAESMAEAINVLSNNLVEVRNSKKQRFESAKKLAFDYEKAKLIEIWSKAV